MEPKEHHPTSRVWVVIPMFNEATVIRSVVADVVAVFPHVVCVDDGSTDGTPDEAAAAGAVVVRHPINLGQGASLQTGIDYALSDPGTSAVVTFDADGQHLIEDAVGMVERLQAEGLDVVIGSRFLDGRTTLTRAKRYVLTMATFYTRLTTGMAMTDAHNGLRAMSRSFAERIQIRQNRMAHASELVGQIKDNEATWAEYPTHIVYTEYSRSKGQSLLNSVNILVDLFFK